MPQPQGLQGTYNSDGGDGRTKDTYVLASPMKANGENGSKKEMSIESLMATNNSRFMPQGMPK